MFSTYCGWGILGSLLLPHPPHPLRCVLASLSPCVFKSSVGGRGYTYIKCKSKGGGGGGGGVKCKMVGVVR